MQVPWNSVELNLCAQDSQATLHMSGPQQEKLQRLTFLGADVNEESCWIVRLADDQVTIFVFSLPFGSDQTSRRWEKTDLSS